LEKVLICRAGHVFKRYPPHTDPRDSALLQDIADGLEAPPAHE
jgi:glutathione peroxidase-family protein